MNITSVYACNDDDGQDFSNVEDEDYKYELLVKG